MIDFPSTVHLHTSFNCKHRPPPKKLVWLNGRWYNNISIFYLTSKTKKAANFNFLRSHFFVFIIQVIKNSYFIWNEANSSHHSHSTIPTVFQADANVWAPPRLLQKGELRMCEYTTTYAKTNRNNFWKNGTRWHYWRRYVGLFLRPIWYSLK